MDKSSSSTNDRTKIQTSISGQVQNNAYQPAPINTDQGQNQPAGLSDAVQTRTQSQSYPPLSKEEKEAIGSLYKETGPTRIVEQKEFTPPSEVKEYLTEVKKEDSIQLPVPVEDEYGQILMEQAAPSKPKIILPLDDQAIKQGMKQKVTNSIRWLVTWCIRLIKMFPGRVAYKKLKE